MGLVIKVNVFSQYFFEWQILLYIKKKKKYISNRIKKGV
jgi:hypothetical protein